MIQPIQRRLAARNENGEGGFTLIELMVVVMIIAILVGIAIPAFLGARRRAQDTASKSDLRNGLGTAQTIFTDNQAYLATATMVTSLTSEEPSLTFQNDTTKSTAAKQISLKTAASSGVATDPLDEIILASQSGSGTCFYFRHVATAGLVDPTKPRSGTYTATTPSGTDCQAGNAPATESNWTAL